MFAMLRYLWNHPEPVVIAGIFLVVELLFCSLAGIWFYIGGFL